MTSLQDKFYYLWPHTITCTQVFVFKPHFNVCAYIFGFFLLAVPFSDCPSLYLWIVASATFHKNVFCKDCFQLHPKPLFLATQNSLTFTPTHQLQHGNCFSLRLLYCHTLATKCPLPAVTCWVILSASFLLCLQLQKTYF